MANINLKKVSYKAIAQLGFPQLLHRTLFRDSLTILMYHGVISAPLLIPDWCFLSEAVFRKQIEYIKNNFQVMSLLDAITMLEKNMIKEPTIAITFDDGFLNNYEVAYPILSQLGLPATIFLVTSLVDTDNTVWFCRLNRAITITKKPFFVWKGKQYNLDSTENKAKALAAIQKYLKELPPVSFVNELNEIIYGLGDVPDCPIEQNSPFRILDSKSIKNMLNSGLIDFGAHSHSHTILSTLPPEEQSNEISRSINAVKKITGNHCQLFSYPNGRKKDYNISSIGILKSCNIKAAVTTIAGLNDNNTSAFEIKRYGVGADTEFNRFICMAHHFIAGTKSFFFGEN